MGYLLGGQFSHSLGEWMSFSCYIFLMLKHVTIEGTEWDRCTENKHLFTLNFAYCFRKKKTIMEDQALKE